MNHFYFKRHYELVKIHIVLYYLALPPSKSIAPSSLAHTQKASLAYWTFYIIKKVSYLTGLIVFVSYIIPLYLHPVDPRNSIKTLFRYILRGLDLTHSTDVLLWTRCPSLSSSSMLLPSQKLFHWAITA